MQIWRLNFVKSPGVIMLRLGDTEASDWSRQPLLASDWSTEIPLTVVGLQIKMPGCIQTIKTSQQRARPPHHNNPGICQDKRSSHQETHLGL